ncbi:hypothetical protein Tco_1003360 [Tanacetum coccineum]|uniref:RNA-directed DNA polymerase, eukaryota n=1 Tax=Tanacetum coccineum TaxID=301880 RepID=A0ABQ5FB66_9ASTR
MHPHTSLVLSLCLDRHLSDHRSILLREIQVDFGPTPFRFYHLWLDLVGFDDLIQTAWRSFTHDDRNGMVRFKKKLQALKIIIRNWVNEKRATSRRSKVTITEKLEQIDKDLDKGTVSDDILLRRSELNCKLSAINDLENNEQFQKSKIQWAIEGDENSKFFHGIINRKRSQMAIRGIFNNGTWCTDPGLVKEAFFNHFADRFKEPANYRCKINFQFPKKLDSSQAEDLERNISSDEIRLAVWNCGDNKSPGPDGYSFEIFFKYWYLVGSDFCGAVEYFFYHGTFPKGCNTAFIALIPKVLDAKLVSDFRPISLIGCVYKVVSKILANRIKTVISDLVSDTQTAFVAGRKILDGPFILEELLQWCKRRSKNALFLKWILPRHMTQFVRIYYWCLDAFGFGNRWWRSSRTIFIHFDYENFGTIFCRVVDSGFSGYSFPGLSINIQKCQLLGVGVSQDIIVQAASAIGCSIMHSQFRYLGVSIGDRKNRLKAWESIVSKLRNLPLGVLNIMEGIRNRFFNGNGQSESKITWIAWNKVLASKKNGGLGVSSFFALNRALLFKWIWRFISKEMVKGWTMVLTQKRIGNGRDTSFWLDCWLDSTPLSVMFPRVFALEEDKDVSVAVKLGSSVCSSFRRDPRGGIEHQQMMELQSLLETVSLSNSKDRWIFDLTGDGVFSVKALRNFIDDKILPSHPEATNWVKNIPIKYIFPLAG